MHCCAALRTQPAAMRLAQGLGPTRPCLRAGRCLHKGVLVAASKGGHSGHKPHPDEEGDPVGLTDAIIEEGKHFVGGRLKDPAAIANRMMKEAARHLQSQESKESPEGTIKKGGLAAQATSVDARKHAADPPEAAALVRGAVRAEHGAGAAEEVAEAIVEAARERMARQPEGKRPEDLAGVLRAGESELARREVREHGHVQKGGLAARAASAGERVAGGGHSEVAKQVEEKLEREGSMGSVGSLGSMGSVDQQQGPVI